MYIRDMIEFRMFILDSTSIRLEFVIVDLEGVPWWTCCQTM